MKYIKFIHDFIGFLVSKGVTSGFSHEEIDQAVHFSQTKLMDNLRPKLPHDKRALTLLRPFMNKESIAVDTQGLAAAPTDEIEAILLDDETPVTFVPRFKWGKKLKSKIAPPTKQYPVYTVEGTELEIRPKDIDKITVYNIREPAQPHYAYQPDGFHKIYDDKNSVDLEWNPAAHAMILDGTLTYLGLSIRENMIVEFSELQQQKANRPV